MKLRMVLVCSILATSGCATTQTVHWQEEPTDAASRVEHLSAEHTARITARNGEAFWAVNIVMANDTLAWEGSQSGVGHRMPMVEVENIEIVTKRRTKQDAKVGAIAGGLVGVLVGATGCIDCSNVNGSYTIGFGVLGAATGALIGAIIGAIRADKVVFVPQE